MAKTVKMCDMNDTIAANVFVMLNPGKLSLKGFVSSIGKVTGIVTTVEPKELTYPEGWYYAKGRFTNKHNSSNGVYYSVFMFDQNGKILEFPYCTSD